MEATNKLPYQNWIAQLLKKHLPLLGAWNQKNLLLFAETLIQSNSIQSNSISQTRIATSCPTSVKVSSDLRRFQRFLAQEIDSHQLDVIPIVAVD